MSLQAPDLMTALGFNADDLAANRAGSLSTGQAARLRKNWRRQLTVSIILVIVLMFVATTLLFLGQRNDSGALTFVGMAITVINGVIVGVGAQSYLRLSGDLRVGSVIATSGVVKRVVRVASGRATSYVIRVGDGGDVNVSKVVFNAFEEGQRYTLYRAAASKALLSAESL
ncbi:MAG: hypothetical protein IPK17_06245 [Chloroflexi bacterium]|uniref:hypothetical protein n=1 Tax=Candidatus Flexifilum breve TaxID=3140694 RepID=UPI003136D7A9|nr:hypothetical protein [Chloroflexota bacterium]